MIYLFCFAVYWHVKELHNYPFNFFCIIFISQRVEITIQLKSFIIKFNFYVNHEVENLPLINGFFIRPSAPRNSNINNNTLVDMHE